MVLNKIEFDESNNIFFYIQNDNDDYVPFLLKRITPDNWKYSCGEILLKNSGASYVFNLNDLFYRVNLYKEEVFDLYLFKPKMSIKKAVKIEGFEFDKKEITISNDFCNINLTVYKNGTNGLSIKVICDKLDKFKLKKADETENALRFKIDTEIPSNSYKVILARRSTVGHEAKYDGFIEIPHLDNAFTLNKNIISDYILKNKETWDFAAVADNRIFTFIADDDFSCEYFDVNDEYSAKIYTSQNIYACLYVKRSGPRKQNKIKVSVLGSCFTRQAFNSAEFMNEDYKKMYEIGLTAFQHSFIQLMGDPIPYEHDDLYGKPNKFVERYGDMILSNTYLSQLKEYSPDYLMIDAYVDSRAPIIPLGDNKYYTKVSFLNDTDFFKKLDSSVYYDLNSDERFELFKSAVDKFADYMQKEMPDLKIVVVRSYMAVNKVENGQTIPWEKEKLPFIKYQREISDRNHDYLISKIKNVKVIDLRDDKYSTEHNPWLDYDFNHLSSQYYKDVLNMFNKIVLQDILKGDLIINE